MMKRAVAFAIVSVALGGCMQATLSPTTEAAWSPRDKALLADPPYERVQVPQQFERHIVTYTRDETPGTILVDEDHHYLYYVLPHHKAIRYGIAVGQRAMAWSGVAKVGRMQEWPPWIPTAGEQKRLGPFPAYVTGGPQNPLGARALYLYADGKDTLYRIHGTNQPEYIGQSISSGCIRMTNRDAIGLYRHVHVGTMVVVLKPHDAVDPATEQFASAPNPSNSF
jgi:lipoprotein-anchoring transpeptidase ErfK/SrfK